MQALMQKTFSTSEVEELAQLLDTNGDGLIGYSEFFDCFEVRGEQLQKN